MAASDDTAAGGRGDGGAGEEPGLERLVRDALLRDTSSASPRAGFRSALRDAFVSGAIEEESAEGRSREPAPSRSADAMSTEDALRTVPAAPAHPAFRAELRERFVSGDLAEAPEPGSGGPRRLAPWAAAVLAAAAAAVLWLVLRPGPDLGPAWDLRAREGAALAWNGAALPAEPAEVGRLLAAGGTLATGEDGALGLELPGAVRLRFAPGSRARLGALEPGAPLRVDLEAGRVLGTTGPAYASEALVVATPRGVATVVGTSFAVDTAAKGCCFCVTEGEVRLEPADPDATEPGPWQEVTDEETTFLFPDGRAVHADLVHAEALEEFLRSERF